MWNLRLLMSRLPSDLVTAKPVLQQLLEPLDVLSVLPLQFLETLPGFTIVLCILQIALEGLHVLGHFGKTATRS